MVWLALFQLVEHQVHRIFEVLIVLTHLHRIDKLNERREILLLHRRFIVDVPDKGGVEQRFRFHPEIVTGFALALGVGDQRRDQLQNVLFRVDVGERVVVHGILEVQGIENLDLIPVLLQRMAAGNHDVPFGIGDDEAGGIGF